MRRLALALVVLAASPALAEDLQFTLKKARAGDKLTVIWRDNKGAMRSDDLLLV